jgi:hypothetical protein
MEKMKIQTLKWGFASIKTNFINSECKFISAKNHEKDQRPPECVSRTVKDQNLFSDFTPLLNLKSFTELFIK